MLMLGVHNLNTQPQPQYVSQGNTSEVYEQHLTTDMIASNPDYLPFVDAYVDSISSILRPISLKIHDNPELNFKEYIAHETLVSFLNTRKGWKVTPSAYGIETAFIAVYDSGKKGPVVSYNAEYGL
jgi:hypothetical protein